MSTGGPLGSGTICGPEKGTRGCLLELSWNGKEPRTIDGSATRIFLEDGNRLTFRGRAKGTVTGGSACSTSLTTSRRNASPRMTKSSADTALRHINDLLARCVPAKEEAEETVRPKAASIGLYAMNFQRFQDRAGSGAFWGKTCD